MHAHRHLRQVDGLAIGPDAADEGDRPLAEPDRDVGEIAVRDVDRRLAPGQSPLPALRLRRAVDSLLLETCRPDHLAAESGPTVEPGDRRALRGADAVEILEARTQGDLAGRPAGRGRGQERGVGRTADGPADGPADRGADRTADEAADQRAGGLQNERGHPLTPLMQATEAPEAEGEGEPAPPEADRRLGDAGAVMRMHHRVPPRGDAAMLGRQVGPPAEEQHVARAVGLGRDRRQMAQRRFRHRLAPRRLRPVGAVGGRLLGLGAGELAIDPAQQAEAIAANAPERRLVQVGRADPAAGRRHDPPGARWGAHGVIVPPSSPASPCRA